MRQRGERRSVRLRTGLDWCADIGVSRAWEFHPSALAEPDVNLSIHPAPIILRPFLSHFSTGLDSSPPVSKKLRLHLLETLQPLPCPTLVGSESLVFPLCPTHQPLIQLLGDASEGCGIIPAVATTSRSAPVRRFGTLTLAIASLGLLPWHRRDRFKGSVYGPAPPNHARPASGPEAGGRDSRIAGPAGTDPDVCTMHRF